MVRIKNEEPSTTTKLTFTGYESPTDKTNSNGPTDRLAYFATAGVASSVLPCHQVVMP